MKYIIKNCPAFDSKYNECHSKIEPHKLYCMDCIDCLLKQIYTLVIQANDCIDEREAVDNILDKFEYKEYAREDLNNVDIQQ